jgi:signal transduction histidine kinase
MGPSSEWCWPVLAVLNSETSKKAIRITVSTRTALAAISEIELLRQAEALSGVGAWRCDATGQGLQWTPQTFVLHGLPAGTPQPTLASAVGLLVPADQQRMRQAIRRSLAQGLGFEEVVELGGDAAVGRRLRCSCRVIETAQGRELLGSWQFAAASAPQLNEMADTLLPGDTEHPHVLNAAEAWRILDIAATQVGFGFGFRDLHGEGAQWSAQLKRMFGLPADAPTPRREQVLDWVEPADRDHVRQQSLHPPAVGELREFEFRLLPDANGVRRVLLTRGTVYSSAVDGHDGPGALQRLYFAIIDITDLRAQDSRVGALRERLQLAAEASGMGTWELHTDSGVGTWDDAAVAIFGLQDAPKPLRVEQFFSRIHPEDRAWMRAAVTRPVRAGDALGENIDLQVRLLIPSATPDQPPSLRWIQTRGKRERDAGGRVVRRVGVCFDITERREADATRRAKDLAEQASLAKTQFLSRMSHELRTPLNAVLGFAQLLALDRAPTLSEAQQTRVAHIQNAGWYLLSLINDVLDLTRLQSHESPLRVEAVPVLPLLHECVQSLTLPDGVLAPVVAGPGSDDAEPLVARVDKARIKQALVHVISRAVQHQPAAGPVHISAKAIDANAGITLTVRDSGALLTPSQRFLSRSVAVLTTPAAPMVWASA